MGVKALKQFACVLGLTFTCLLSLEARAGAQATETVLYHFGSTSTDGIDFYSALIIDQAGNLYGTTALGGTNGVGTVFELVNSSGTYTETTLYNFGATSTDGVTPVAGVIMDKAGNLYGTTSSGGTNGHGTVFELVNSSGTYTETILYNFGATGTDGIEPAAALIMDKAGNLYGTTKCGGRSNIGSAGSGASAGTGCGQGGTAFELVNSSGTYTETILYNFGATGSDGTSPVAALIMDKVGNLYGTSPSGGTNGHGTVFELVNSSGTYTEAILYNFGATGTDGIDPAAGLIMDAAGNLYGTTPSGGTNIGSATTGSGAGKGGGDGTVFELVNSSGTPVYLQGVINIYTETVLYNFGSTSTDGTGPVTGLIMDNAGNLYGTAQSRGTNGDGTVFELVNSSGTYTETVLYNFGSTSTDGIEPAAALIMDNAGNLYGTTPCGSIPDWVEVINASPTNSGTAGELRCNGPTSIVFKLSPPAFTTSVSSSFNPALAGQSVTINVGISCNGCGPALPPFAAGTVQLFNGSTLLGTLSVSGSTSLEPAGQPTAQFTFDDAATLGIGSFTLAALFTANNSFEGQSSGTLVQTVNELGAALTDGSNTFSGNQTVAGSLTATSLFGNGAGILDLNPANLGPGTAGINITGNAGTATYATSAGTAQSAVSATTAQSATYATTAGTANTAVSATSATTAGTADGLLVGAASIPALDFARLDIGNVFNGNQAVKGNQIVSGSLTIGGGTPISEYISIVQAITVPALLPGACTTFTTAALDGFTPGTLDTIALGISSSLLKGSSLNFQAWETSSTANTTVTIQACNLGLNFKVSTGSVRVDIFRH